MISGYATRTVPVLSVTQMYRAPVLSFPGFFPLRAAMIALPGACDVFTMRPLTLAQWGAVLGLSSLQR